MNNFVYMRMAIAKVPKVKIKVNVKMRKALRFGGFSKMGTIPAGGVPAGSSNSVRSCSGVGVVVVVAMVNLANVKGDERLSKQSSNWEKTRMKSMKKGRSHRHHLSRI